MTAKGRVWFLFGLPAFQMERQRLMQGLTLVNRPLEANKGVVIIAVSKNYWLLWNIKIWLLPQGWVVAAQTSRPTTSSTIRSSTVQCVREVGTCGEDEDNCTFYSFVLFLSPGLVCWRSGGAYWPPRLSGCLFFREIAAAYALEIGSCPPFGLFLVVGSKSLQSVGFQPVLELLAHLARTRERIWTRATRTPQPM